MYIITTIICGLNTSGIKVENTEAIDETLNVIKMIFTPINAMIGLSSLGNIFGKVKDQVIDTQKAGKRLIIVLVAFLIILVFESNYIGNFINNLLG